MESICATFGQAHGVAWEREGTERIGSFGRKKAQIPLKLRDLGLIRWLRGLDLNQRPSGYEPDELPDCSTPRSEERVNNALPPGACKRKVPKNQIAQISRPPDSFNRLSPACLQMPGIVAYRRIAGRRVVFVFILRRPVR